MAQKLDRLIQITKSEIPAEKGTKRYEGFEALLLCDGKTYRHFRSLAHVSLENGRTNFSPSTVWRFAERQGFAKFEGENKPNPTSTLKSVVTTAAIFSDKEKEPYPELNAIRQLVCNDSLSLDRPGIYAWRIEGGAVYVGKYTHKSRPISEYNRNVQRILCDEPYRPQNPTGFRRIHRALAYAVREGLAIELHVLENCSPEELNVREKYWIATLANGGLNA